jgi:tripartite-type tricarboxylate transporter receptor subunit TctC
MRIRFGTLLTFVALGLTTVPFYQAASQSYPTRQITMVIPFPAGGNLEIVARPLAERLSAALGQPVIIENRPGGAGGTVGTKAVANAKPDGHTLLLTPFAPLVTAPAIYKNLGYDPPKDFTPVATLYSVPHMLVVHPALPVDSMEQLVSYTKANPGKVSYAHPGFGTQPHLLAELFRLTTAAGVSGSSRMDMSRLTTVCSKGSGNSDMSKGRTWLWSVGMRRAGQSGSRILR